MHAVWIFAAIVVEYVPAAHFTQVAMFRAPALKLYVPAAHFVHVEEELAPDADEYVPAVHKIQLPLA
jgi:hypothetical protein